MAEISKKHAEVLELINRGYTNGEICNQLGIKHHTIYYVKRKYKHAITPTEATDKYTDINKFDANIDYILKGNILKIGNELARRPLEKSSIQQLCTAFGILFDKHRLHTGKSTTNISSNIVKSLDSTQIKIIQDSIKSLKESMLLEHKSGKG